MESKIINSEFEQLILHIGGWDMQTNTFASGLMTENIKQSAKMRLGKIRDILSKEYQTIMESQLIIFSRITPESTREERDEANAEIAELMAGETTVYIANPADFNMLFDFQSSTIYNYDLVGRNICENYTPLD